MLSFFGYYIYIITIILVELVMCFRVFVNELKISGGADNIFVDEKFVRMDSQSVIVLISFPFFVSSPLSQLERVSTSWHV